MTRNGIKALFEKNRYYSYAAERYLAIGDPDAPMREPTISFDTTPPIIPLSAEVISDVPIVPELDENGDPLGYCVELPQKDIDAFLYFLDNCHMSAGSDDTVEAMCTWERFRAERATRSPTCPACASVTAHSKPKNTARAAPSSSPHRTIYIPTS